MYYLENGRVSRVNSQQEGSFTSNSFGSERRASAEQPKSHAKPNKVGVWRPSLGIAGMLFIALPLSSNSQSAVCPGWGPKNIHLVVCALRRVALPGCFV